MAFKIAFGPPEKTNKLIPTSAPQGSKRLIPSISGRCENLTVFLLVPEILNAPVKVLGVCGTFDIGLDGGSDPLSPQALPVETLIPAVLTDVVGPSLLVTKSIARF